MIKYQKNIVIFQKRIMQYILWSGDISFKILPKQTYSNSIKSFKTNVILDSSIFPFQCGNFQWELFNKKAFIWYAETRKWFLNARKLKWKLEVFLIVPTIKALVNRDSVRVLFIVFLNKKKWNWRVLLRKIPTWKKKSLLGYCHGKLSSCSGEPYKWIKLSDSNKTFRSWYFTFQQTDNNSIN